jgi:chromosomal replication initiator protein
MLRSEVGESAYTSWIKPVTLIGIESGVVRVTVPTRFMRD